MPIDDIVVEQKRNPKVIIGTPAKVPRIASFLESWFRAAGKGVLRMSPERMIAPGRFTALPTAGVDFEGAFGYLVGDGLYVCQPDGGGGWEWLRVEGTVLP